MADDGNQRLQVFKLDLGGPDASESVNLKFVRAISIAWANGKDRSANQKESDRLLNVAVRTRWHNGHSEDMVSISHHTSAEEDHDKLIGCISEFLLKYGSFVRSIGSDFLQGPSTMAIMPGGELAVTDYKINKICVIRADSSLKCMFGDDTLESPYGIAVDTHRNFAV